MAENLCKEGVISDLRNGSAETAGQFQRGTQIPSALSKTLASTSACLRVLIVGECGDGKSTLLNNLLGLTGAQAATTGRSAGGVTKQITEYSTDKQINGKAVVLLDSPGVGDMDVTAVQLLSLIEESLSSHHHRPEDALDALIVTTPSSDARIKLGAQVVQTLVEKGFIGPDKWKNVILNGTKMDKADPEDVTFFKEEIFKAFFGADVCQNGSAGQSTLTSLDDTSQIWMALENLPAAKVIYQKPDVEDMSKALAAKLGVNDEIFKGQLNQERLRADELMKEAVAAKAKALQEEERANKEQQARKAADAKAAQEAERANKEQQARKAADAKAAQEAARANQIAAAAKKAKEEAETAAVNAAQKAKEAAAAAAQQAKADAEKVAAAAALKAQADADKATAAAAQKAKADSTKAAAAAAEVARKEAEEAATAETARLELELETAREAVTAARKAQKPAAEKPAAPQPAAPQPQTRHAEKRLVLKAAPHMCLDADIHAGAQNGGKIHLWEKVDNFDTRNQFWKLDSDGRLILKAAPHMCLNADINGGAQNGGTLHLWEKVDNIDARNQIWLFQQ